jgi:hypothetical protein
MVTNWFSSFLFLLDYPRNKELAEKAAMSPSNFTRIFISSYPPVQLYRGIGRVIVDGLEVFRLYREPGYVLEGREA